MNAFTLPKWYDLHTHFRQGPVVGSYVQAHREMGCAGVLAMPNTKPPVAVVFEKDENGTYWSAERYMRALRAAGADQFEALIVPLYLTQDTTPAMIADGARAGALQACKYYPPHGTTGAEFGVPLDVLIENGVLAALEEHGIVLCVHGEAHALPPNRYFDHQDNAESIFYSEMLPRVREKFPNLKIVCEHITTAQAARFVKNAGSNTAASITPQHLLYTVGDLIQGLKYHLFCLPVVKFSEDREALRRAVCDPNNTQFFAGTDSAPHTKKMTPCGCAAGCFTGGIAPQLYAQGFEASGVDLSTAGGQNTFQRFLCENGPRFYGLPVSQERFTLRREEHRVAALDTSEGTVVPLPLGMGIDTLPWSVAL